MEQFKCGYCSFILKYDQLAQHSCFIASTGKHALVMDEERNIFIAENETNEGNTCDKDRLDEDVITAVKNRPALYDFRLPLKQRGRKQKDDLWTEVSLYLKGLYTPTEAEKRWNYLKDCYRKARNLFKKRQIIEQKSGAAGIPKSEAIVPSFRYYSLMTFLNDTLEHRQTITSLRTATDNQQASTSTSASPYIDDLDDMQSDINDTLECESSLSSRSTPTSVQSKKRKKSQNLDEYERSLIKALTENKETSPMDKIDGFVMRLSEGLRRLSYKQRSKLEIEFLKRNCTKLKRNRRFRAYLQIFCNS